MPEQLPSNLSQKIRVLFTDVDDTLTFNGEIPFETIQAIHQLRAAGILVVPVTGASAGWCDCLLKTLPIKYIVGENGAFYMEQAEGGHTIIHYLKAAEQVDQDLDELKELAIKLKKTFPDIGFTQDQNFRISDVALDIGQAVKVDFFRAKQATEWLKSQGVNAKLSSIHINIWIGDYNKASGAMAWLETQQIALGECAFIGDSTNDEAMFESIPLTVGVANVQRFLPTLSHKPDYITQQNGGLGFIELANALLDKKIEYKIY
ncbi:HAD family hydrolase [Oceanospirillum sp.]|uniref:HAD family hydrolase n=1 Tax=Oceanospirillum sp. TaxID=2021254 RepID=UPI003A943639